MKKVLALLLAAMLGISLAACGKGKNDTSSEDVGGLTGGWENSDSPVVTDEVKAVLEKATAEMTGATYEPVAYIGSQVVAGTNHRILCKMTPVVPDAESTYAIVTVYEDLEGNASVIEVLNSEAKVMVTDEELDGGWSAPKSPELTKESIDVLKKATEKSAKGSFSPVALLGTQVVAGINYCMLCEITPVTENPESHYSVVVVYDGADGTTSVLETFDFSSDAAE